MRPGACEGACEGACVRMCMHLQHAAEAPHVDLLVVALAPQQLGRRVARRADVLRHRRLEPQVARDAKVGELGVVPLVEQHVGRLEVAVDDRRRLRVQVGERARDAVGDRQLVRAPLERRVELAVEDERLERAAAAQLEHQADLGRVERPRAAEQLHDVGVAQLEHQLGLGLEGGEVRLRQVAPVEQLERHRRAAPPRHAHLGERAGAEPLAHLELGVVDARVAQPLGHVAHLARERVALRRRRVVPHAQRLQLEVDLGARRDRRGRLRKLAPQQPLGAQRAEHHEEGGDVPPARLHQRVVEPREGLGRRRRGQRPRQPAAEV